MTKARSPLESRLRTYRQHHVSALAWMLVAAAAVASLAEVVLRRPLYEQLAVQLALLVAGAAAFARSSWGEHRRRALDRNVRLQLQLRNEELDAFAYTASHDLKAPLVSIDGLAASLERRAGPLLDERGLHYVQRIRANAAALQRLIRDLFEFARIGVETDLSDEIDSTDLARQVVAEAQDRAEAAGAAVELVTAIPPIAAHPVRFKQALTNLVDNALAHAAAGGLRVQVSARELPDACVEVVVEDNGSGVPVPEREKIFQPLVRGHEARHRAPDGTGMGLALVRRIAEANGGSVRYEARGDSGARFVLVFPRCERKALTQPKEPT